MLGTEIFTVSFSSRTLISLLTREAILLYNESEKQVATDLVHRMIQRAIAMDGTITGEHGVGLKKREYLREELERRLLMQCGRLVSTSSCDLPHRR